MTPEAEPAGRGICVDTPAAPGEVGLAVTVVPAIEGLQARLELPAGRVPLRSNWPGQVRGGHWSAAYVAVPPKASPSTSRSRPMARARPATAACCCGRPRPVDPASGRLPSWLDRPGIAWDFRVVDVTPLR